RTGPALIAAQLAVSLGLVVAGGLFVRGAMKAASADPGFPLDRQLLFSTDASTICYEEPSAGAGGLRACTGSPSTMTGRRARGARLDRLVRRALGESVRLRDGRDKMAA